MFSTTVVPPKSFGGWGKQASVGEPIALEFLHEDTLKPLGFMWANGEIVDDEFKTPAMSCLDGLPCNFQKTEFNGNVGFKPVCELKATGAFCGFSVVASAPVRPYVIGILKRYAVELNKHFMKIYLCPKTKSPMIQFNRVTDSGVSDLRMTCSPGCRCPTLYASDVVCHGEDVVPFVALVNGKPDYTCRDQLKTFGSLKDLVIYGSKSASKHYTLKGAIADYIEKEKADAKARSEDIKEAKAKGLKVTTVKTKNIKEVAAAKKKTPAKRAKVQPIEEKKEDEEEEEEDEADSDAVEIDE